MLTQTQPQLDDILTIVRQQPVTDLHTHCYSPRFGHSGDGTGRGLLLWGVDELVTYHYLIAELFRVMEPEDLSYEQFWAMPKPRQADLIWRKLFVEYTPISEACRGVITTLTRLGLDPTESTLEPYRRWFAQQEVDRFVDHVMELANVDSITMTNELFSDHERQLWLEQSDLNDDRRFQSVLRIDTMISDWPQAVGQLNQWGYDVQPAFTDQTVRNTRRCLDDWIKRMKPRYVAMSLDPSFTYPDDHNEAVNQFVSKVLMPTLREHNLAWAMMIGSRRGVNPPLRDAGDMGLRADINAVVNLCAQFPDNRFMVTMLARDNQHELAVAARKFRNLLPFGCWWFLNNPSLIEEITRMRLELLGTSFCPQHSDARILDQLIYKWDHSRQVIAKVLTDKYAELAQSGYSVSEDHIRRDVRLLLRDNFRNFCG